jgi:predicted N-acyltransferase
VTERLRIVAHLEQLPAANWQSLVHSHPALRLEVLQAFTETAARPLPPRIFLLEDASGIAAAAICQAVLGAASRNSLDALLYGRAVHLARRFGAATQPLLQVKIPFGPGSPVILRAAPPAEQRRLLEKLLAGIEEHAREQHLGVAFIDICSDEELLSAAIRARGYLATTMYPIARMEIEWTDFDGYVKRLAQRRRKTAATVRNERNRNRSAGVVIRQIPNDPAAVQDLERLAREHHRQKNRREPNYGPRFLPQLQQRLGEDLLIFEAARAGKRIAMLGAVRSGSVGWVSWFGIEATDRQNDFTYANLAYYHLADRATALGLKTLTYGTAALEAKRLRGCKVSASQLFYRPRRRLLRLLARPYFALHGAWYRRKLK